MSDKGNLWTSLSGPQQDSDMQFASILNFWEDLHNVYTINFQELQTISDQDFQFHWMMAGRGTIKTNSSTYKKTFPHLLTRLFAFVLVLEFRSS